MENEYGIPHSAFLIGIDVRGMLSFIYSGTFNEFSTKIRYQVDVFSELLLTFPPFLVNLPFLFC